MMRSMVCMGVSMLLLGSMMMMRRAGLHGSLRTPTWEHDDDEKSWLAWESENSYLGA